MNVDLKKEAHKASSMGFNPVPVEGGDSKRPARKKHNSSFMESEEIDSTNWANFGISTGGISGNLGVLDFDLKNSEDAKGVLKRFSDRVGPELMSKLVVQKTKNKGYHFLYRCEVCLSNAKLAKNEKGHAIIETREEGGYIKCAPSEGYKWLRGDLSKVSVITPSERHNLFAASRLENKMIVKEAGKRLARSDKKYLEKFPEFNSDQDVGLTLLYEYGWSDCGEDDEWINLTRPGKSSGISAGYHKEKKFLYVFTTSQDNFETERPYNNHAIYAELEHDGDYKEAYKALYRDGHATDDSEVEVDDDLEDEIEFKEGVDELSFLSDEQEENEYLEQAVKGQIAQGKSTGWLSLDEHMRLKENSFNMGIGYDGVGKSVFMLSLACASSVLHNWKWGMIMPENRTAMSRRRLVEAMYGRGIKSYHNEEDLFNERVLDSRERFKIISNKKHYSIKDVLKMGKRMYEVHGIKALLIDPYNFFKVEGNGYSHNNEILSQIRVFAEKYCAVWVMAHPSSNAPRNNKDEEGFLKAPSKYSVQGGADFPYRVDDFFVTHRVVNHPDKETMRTMQVIVEKVKETETGGGVHSNEDYTGLLFESRDGFLGYWDEEGNNPMYTAIQNKLKLTQGSVITVSPEEAF